jgi:hypothetical protein
MAWTFSFSILQRLKRAARNYRPLPAFSFDQCIFAKDVRFRLNSVKRIWFYLKGIILWCIWLPRNDVVFNRTFWSEPTIQFHIWEQLLDYGRIVLTFSFSTLMNIIHHDSFTLIGCTNCMLTHINHI